MLPNRLQDLVSLRHLDIQGASSLIEMPTGMGKLKHLNFLSDYIVGEEEENGIRELGSLDNLHGSFCISKLENIKNRGEASEANMGNKKHINTLILVWHPDDNADDVETARDILDRLQPHQNLKELLIEGYWGQTFADWLGLSCYSKMTGLSLMTVQFDVFEELACSLPRAPKLCQLSVNGGNVKPHNEVISITQLAMSALECLSHIQSPGQLQLNWLLEIEVRECGLLTFPLGNFPNLKKLKLSSFKNMEYVEVPHALPSLLYLDISFCSSLISLPALGRAAPRLEVLSIQYCAIVDCFAEECLPQSLKQLRINGCDELASWIASKGLQCQGLTHLLVSSCHPRPLGDKS
ncbi:hypothetical protein PIB30_076945 [Stylosanthes scabra]|uniref:R13L1/DRL21-like LRR repeat region domain-containing protein n=1 Tax=Stylosanthes scabra TaxID=79078 RepID=A0ABU6VSE6_9FABA|nr:hypothetical protein [Stylosanthes scabra]